MSRPARLRSEILDIWKFFVKKTIFFKLRLLRAQRQLRAVLWTVFEAIGLFSGFLKISRGFSDSGPFYERCMVTSEILSEISVSKCQFPMPEWLDLVVKPCRKVFLVVPTNHKQNNSIKSIKTPTGIDVFHDFVSLVRMAETSFFKVSSPRVRSSRIFGVLI